MRGRDVLVGMLIGGVLVMMLIGHGTGKSPSSAPTAHTSSSTSARHPTATGLSTRRTARPSATARQSAPGHAARPPRDPADRPIPTSWLVGGLSSVAVGAAVGAVVVAYRRPRVDQTGDESGNKE